MNANKNNLKIARVMLMARIANGDDLFPLYDPTAEDIASLLPVQKMLDKIKRASRQNKIKRKVMR